MNVNAYKRKTKCSKIVILMTAFLIAILLVPLGLSAQEYQLSLNQRRMGSQIGVEIWAKSLKSNTAKLGNMSVALVYNEAFLKPAAITSAAGIDTGNPAATTDSIYYDLNTVQPYITITSPFGQSDNGFANLKAKSVQVNNGGVTARVMTLEAVLNPNGAGYQPSTAGRGTFLGLVKFNIVNPTMGTLTDDELTNIAFNTTYTFAPTIVITDAKGNDVTSAVELAPVADFAIRDITILSPAGEGNVVRRYSDPALASISPNPGYPIYFERSGLLSDLETYGTYGTETLGYEVGISLNNGESFSMIGRFVETAIDANSMNGKNINYATGEISKASSKNPYYVTRGDGVALPLASARPANGYGGVVRFIIEGNENYAFRSEEAVFKISQLDANNATTTYNTAPIENRTVLDGEGRYDVTDYSLVLSRMFFVQLNGKDQYLKTANIITTPAEITVSAWVNLNSAADVDSEPAIIASGNPTANNLGPWMLYMKDGLYPAFKAVERDGETLDELVADVVSPIALTPVGDMAPINYEHGDNWVHLAATVNDGTIILYMNGEVVAKETSKKRNIMNMYTMQHPIYIGVNPNFGGLAKTGNYLHAGIKEVKVWRAALKQSQIRKYVAGIYQPSTIGVAADDRNLLELYYPLQGNHLDYATEKINQWGEELLNFYSGNSITTNNHLIQYRPDRAHITLTSPIGGEGVSNLKDKLYEVRWAGYGLGSVNPNTQDLQIMISRDNGVTWFDAIGADANPALPLDQVEIEDGIAYWSPYNNTTIPDFDNDLQAVVSINHNYEKESRMRISGTEADGLDGIYAISEPFIVAPNFAFSNKGTARVTINENKELSFAGNVNMIEAWIKPYRFPTQAEGSFPLFCKKDGAKMQYAFRLLPTGQLSLSVLDTLTNKVVTALSSADYAVVGPNTISADSTWTHVVAWVNLADGGKSTAVRFYIDGVCDLSEEIVGQFGPNIKVDRNNEYPCYIGYEPRSEDVNDASHFIGEIKEIRFWNGNPGDLELTGVEPSDLTLFIQGSQGIRADELTTFGGVNYEQNLVASWICNGGSWINSGLQKSIEVYPANNPDLIAVVYGDGYQYVSTKPFIKIVEPLYQQNVSNLDKDLRVRWVGWDYDRNDADSPLRNGSDAKNSADLDFSVGGGGGSQVQPYQAVASQNYNDSYQNSMMFNYLNKQYEFLGTGSRTQYAADLDMSVTDPDENDDYEYADQGPIPASQTNGRLRLTGRATINGSELTYNNDDDGYIYHLLAESELFNITPPSNFTVRVLLEGYHTGTDSKNGGIQSDLGSSFAAKGLSIKLYENQANLPGEFVAMGESKSGYINKAAEKIANYKTGDMNYANVPFVFTDLRDGRYFVTVDHINHLPVTSSYAAPFYFSGDDQATWAVESGWDFSGWNGVKDNDLTNGEATTNPPTMGDKYPARGPSETNANETAYSRTQLIYNSGRTGDIVTGMMPAMVGGDVYRDGTINAYDRAAVNQNVGGIVASADVTGDGMVNADDRIIVYRNTGMATSSGDHPSGAVVTEYTPGPIAAPLQMADYHLDVDNAVVASMLRAEQAFYDNGGTDADRFAKHYKINNRLQGSDDISYEVYAEASKIDQYVDVAVYIKNTGGNWALGNTTIGLKYDPTALHFDAYYGENQVLFSGNGSNADYGYSSVYSNPSENTIKPIAGLRTIDIVHGQDAPGKISGVEVPTEKTYLGTLRFQIDRVADYKFEWHKITVVHDVDGLTLTKNGNFNYITPILIEQTATITYPVMTERLLASRPYTVKWTEPTNKDMMVDVMLSTDNGNVWSQINVEPISIAARELYWVTPNINSTECLVQLREVESQSMIDVIAGTFSILSEPIEIIKPCGLCGTLLANSNSEIVWTTSQNKNVFFEFSADGLNNWTKITDVMSSTNLTATWMVPEVNTANAVVRMVGQDGTVLSVSTPFSILTGALAINNPAGEILTGSQATDIDWDYDNVDLFDIAFSADAGANWEVIAQDVNASAGSLNWNVPNISTTDAMLVAYVDGMPELEYSRVKFMITPNTNVNDPAALGYTLSSAMPNPFSERTELRFSLPTMETVSVDLFDLAGNKVATLINSTMYSAGNHAFTIDATDLSTGTYVVRLNAGQFALTQRVLVIK